MPSADSTPQRLVLTLAVAGGLSGLVLAGVFMATAPRIERNQAEALEAAIYRVLPGTSSIAAFVVRDGALERDTSGSRVPRGEAVFAGYGDGGALVGWAIPAQGPGFQDTLRLIYGYDPGRRVIVGMEVLDSRETPGLGDKIITDAHFRANFEALVVEPAIVPVKRNKKTADNQVDCITGATISSEAVVRIIDGSMRRWLPLLGAAADGAGEAANGSTDRP